LARAPVDAGHLAIQELLLRLARATGSDGRFELPTRPTDPARSIDVFIRDDQRRRMIVAEAWNTFGDVGAGARSFDRKLAAARDLAVAIGIAGPMMFTVSGSSGPRRATARWSAGIRKCSRDAFLDRRRAGVRTLMYGESPPAEAGLVWSDVSETRIFAWRRPAGL